ncbi:MAG TPA: hypothetical protein VLY24_07255 [Bryobacteraceae bacterium]|nr:hypothetical protein [Bryobacteraceae bacterium]
MDHVTTSLNPLPAAQSEPAPVTSPRSARKGPSAATPVFRALFTTASTATAPAAKLAATTPVATPAATSNAAPASAPSTSAPTAESVFGANPFESNPVGFNPDGSQFSYNPVYFATASTAQQVAQMLGGTVIESNALAPNAQQQPNLMVQMPDGRTINAGLVASFYTHGYPQSYVDGLIDSEINGTAS